MLRSKKCDNGASFGRVVRNVRASYVCIRCTVREKTISTLFWRAPKTKLAIFSIKLRANHSSHHIMYILNLSSQINMLRNNQSQIEQCASLQDTKHSDKQRNQRNQRDKSLSLKMLSTLGICPGGMGVPRVCCDTVLMRGSNLSAVSWERWQRRVVLQK